MFEDFTMSTNIATGCELDTPLPSYEQNCGYPTRNGNVFVDGADCVSKPADGMHDGFCYHVPVEEKNLFNS